MLVPALLTGAVFGVLTFPALGPYAIALGLLGALAGALAADRANPRRLLDVDPHDDGLDADPIEPTEHEWIAHKADPDGPAWLESAAARSLRYAGVPHVDVPPAPHVDVPPVPPLRIPPINRPH